MLILDDDKRLNIQLAETEVAILQAAATIFSAHINAATVADTNEKDIMQKSIRQAIKLSVGIDDLIKAEGEI